MANIVWLRFVVLLPKYCKQDQAAIIIIGSADFLPTNLSWPEIIIPRKKIWVGFATIRILYITENIGGADSSTIFSNYLTISPPQVSSYTHNQNLRPLNLPSNSFPRPSQTPPTDPPPPPSPNATTSPLAPRPETVTANDLAAFLYSIKKFPNLQSPRIGLAYLCTCTASASSSFPWRRSVLARVSMLCIVN